MAIFEEDEFHKMKDPVEMEKARTETLKKKHRLQGKAIKEIQELMESMSYPDCNEVKQGKICASDTADTDDLTQQVLELLQGQPLKPREVVNRLRSNDEQEVREVIRLLIERGEIKSSADWRLRLCSK